MAGSTTEGQVHSSVMDIYSKLASKREQEREQRIEQKRQEAEARKKEREERYKHEDGTKMSKEERRKADLESWREIVCGLTGDDLEYSGKRKNKKKKYTKWLGPESTASEITTGKKKPKKKNYRKEFEPELNMLRTLVAEQNRFTTDLQKRFQIAAGPASKDGMALNKTLVELASVIASGRSNSLGVLKEIGNLKKTIADLYMKQKKLDSDLSKGGATDATTTDLGLMGSSIASSIFGDDILNGTLRGVMPQASVSASPEYYIPSVPAGAPQVTTGGNNAPVVQQGAVDSSFDPNSWNGPTLQNDFTMYESIPHHIEVEWNQGTNQKRFVAINDATGEELVGCNIPTVDPNTLDVNERDMTVKGSFDEIYRLRVVS